MQFSFIICLLSTRVCWRAKGDAISVNNHKELTKKGFLHFLSYITYNTRHIQRYSFSVYLLQQREVQPLQVLQIFSFVWCARVNFNVTAITLLYIYFFVFLAIPRTSYTATPPYEEISLIKTQRCTTTAPRT